MAEYKEAKTPHSGSKKLDHIRLHKGEDGGHVAEHHYAENGMVYHKPGRYVFGADEGNDLVQHLAKHMGIKPSAAEEKAEGEE